MRSFTLITLAATLTVASAKTNLEDCTSTTIAATGGSSSQIIHYIPSSGEICTLLDCGGGRAPPKTIPGCPAYTGTETVTPSFLSGYEGVKATATVTGPTDVEAKATDVASTTAAAAEGAELSVSAAAYAAADESDDAADAEDDADTTEELLETAAPMTATSTMAAAESVSVAAVDSTCACAAPPVTITSYTSYAAMTSGTSYPTGTISMSFGNGTVKGPSSVPASAFTGAAAVGNVKAKGVVGLGLAALIAAAL